MGDGIRNDVGYHVGSHVPAAYDPLLAKLLVHAPTPATSLLIAVGAPLTPTSSKASLLISNNSPPSSAILTFVRAPPRFNPWTRFRPMRFSPASQTMPSSPPPPHLRPPNAVADPWGAVGAWRSTGRHTLRYAHRGVATEVIVERLPGHANAWRLIRSDGSSHSLEFGVTRTAGGELLLDIGDTQQQWIARRSGRLLSLESPDGRRYALAPPRSSPAAATTEAVPGEIRAPMNGAIVSVLVQHGDRVHACQPLLVMEAMKMEHTITAAAHGVVETVACAPGVNVAADDLLIELDLGGEEP